MAWEELRDFLTAHDRQSFTDTELSSKINRGKGTVQDALYAHKSVFWKEPSGHWRLRTADDSDQPSLPQPAAIEAPSEHAADAAMEFPLRVSVNTEAGHVRVVLSDQVDYVKCSPKGAKLLAEMLTSAAGDIPGQEVTEATVTQAQAQQNMAANATAEVPAVNGPSVPTPFTDVPKPSRYWSPIPEHGPYLKRMLELTMLMSLSDKGTPDDDIRAETIWDEFYHLLDHQWDWAEAKRITDDALGAAWSAEWGEDPENRIEGDPVFHFAWHAMHAALLPVITNLRKLHDEKRLLAAEIKRTSTGSKGPA